MKKLTEEQKEFVAKVAEDSVNQTIDVDQIREAFKLLTEDDSTMNIRIMRKRLYDHFMNPKPDVLPDFANPDFDITQELPVEKKVELPKAELNTVVDKRTKEYKEWKKNTNIND